MSNAILSGAIHYFRVHPAYWKDRLLKLRACGFNTVETYIPWNFHEPKEGVYRFDGFHDVTGFIKSAEEVGLKVILRPGPYICAEWDFGGLPAWLNAYPSMRLRCFWPQYLEKVRGWFSRLIPMLVPYLSTNGGPVIAMQVENEYGSYGADKKYLRFIHELLLELGADCLLFTSDGWNAAMLSGGTLPEVWKTVNFGSKPEDAFAALRKVQPDGPDMCCEFWCGWFDHWGENHHTRDAADAAGVLDRIVKNGGAGGSVNMYMFHGGTNFGFWNGANVDQNRQYQPTTTSYDYNALLSEAGDITPLYEACKAVLEKHFGKAPEIEVKNSKKKSYGTVVFNERFSLWDNLGEPVEAACPLTMEELGQEYGYVLYRTTVTAPEFDVYELKISGLRDRAVVFVDGVKTGVLYRNQPDDSLVLPVAAGQTFRLDILVENMGRVNYGPDMAYACGISGSVRLKYHNLFDWKMYKLPFDEPFNLRSTRGDLRSAAAECDCPVFLKGTFHASELCDTFLDFSSFRKGIAFVNGFNLGRYWEEGPARTLYIPAPLLREGENELVLFETDGFSKPEVVLTDSPKWINI